jgi:hypothetical protein
MHQPIPDQGKWLKRVVQGYINYDAVSTNHRALTAFRDEVTKCWRRTLSRRSQRAALSWKRMKDLADIWLTDQTTLLQYFRSRSAVGNTRCMFWSSRNFFRENHSGRPHQNGSECKVSNGPPQRPAVWSGVSGGRLTSLSALLDQSL